MGGTKGDPEYKAMQEEIETIMRNLKEEQKQVQDCKLESLAVGDVGKPRLQSKRLLKGHIHKITAVSFSGDSRHLVSASLDGKLIVWDCYSGNKVQIIPLRSSWVMTTSFSPSGKFVASGGMDNMATVFDLHNRDTSGVAKILRELAGYDGFLSCCKFVSDSTFLTGSGDMKICVWDIEAGRRVSELYGHSGDVVSISMKPGDENIFVTGSVDKSAKLWDLRQKAACQTFWGHEGDVNSVFYHPSGRGFSSASEDKTCRLFDFRSDQQVACYKGAASAGGFTSNVLSKSGRFVFAASDDSNVYIWDVLTSSDAGTFTGHENRVTCISITENGMALATSSWDQNIRIWL